MKKAAVIVLVLWAGIAATNVIATEDHALTVSVDLKDGSRIVGTTELKTVKLVATYGSIDIAASEIRTIAVNADLETGSITMVNDDRMQGVLGLGDLSVSSLVGQLKLKLVDVKLITFTQPEPPKK